MRPQLHRAAQVSILSFVALASQAFGFQAEDETGITTAPAQPVHAQATDDFAPLNYVGGRGLITMEGVTGMFLNPTSGTLPQFQVTAQYCAAVLRQPDGEDILHTAMIGYGVTDWLEVGALLRITEQDPGNDIAAGGLYARLRLLRDEEWRPEVSVGVISRLGHNALEKQTLFIAASKRFAIDEDGVIRAFRLHGGFRQIWQDSSVNEANGSIGYVGGEFELPLDLFLVGEISNKDDLFNHTPYAIGMQWRPSQLIGISLAGIQTGSETRLSLYAGIGISFGF